MLPQSVIDAREARANRLSLGTTRTSNNPNRGILAGTSVSAQTSAPSKLINSSIENLYSNDFNRMGFYESVYHSFMPADSITELILTAMMVGRNVNFSLVENEREEMLLKTTFQMLGNLGNTAQSAISSKAVVSKSIDSGRTFDIVQLPYSIENALVGIVVSGTIAESDVLKDMKNAVKISLLTGSQTQADNRFLYIGRCKTTLTDAYTPFNFTKSAMIVVDEAETQNINFS